MSSRIVSFNFYLCVLIAWAAVGCKTTDEKERQASTLRLHLETHSDSTGRSGPVPVYRKTPVLVNVERQPFLTEGDVEYASVVQTKDGGFAILVQFNRHGTLLLNNITSDYSGRRIAVQSLFDEMRWLGAPRIQRRIANGTFVFTPDATEEEAQRIVRGINNVVAQIRKRARY